MVLAALVLSSSVLLSAAGADFPDFQYKLDIAGDGVYRLGFEDLDYTGDTLPSNRLGVFVRGSEVPAWVEDGGDGRFGAGDTISFVGRRLEGRNSYFDEHSRYNVYWLVLKDRDGLRMQDGDAAAASAASSVPAIVTRRLEQERLRVALPAAADSESAESWYMSRLSHLDARPYSWDVDLGDQERASGPYSIRAGLAGLSRDRNARETGQAHHRVELILNGTTIGSGEWDGQEPYVIEAAAVDPGLLEGGMNRIEIKVPRRIAAGASSPLIDVSLLNWIEFSYPFDGSGKGQQRLEAMRAKGTVSEVTVPAIQSPDALLFSPSGRRLGLADARGRDLQLDEAGYWFLVPGDDYLAPVSIRRDQPAGLLSTGQQADYLIVAHATLEDAVEPLAAFHRKRGLSVAVIDVEDIYDEFNAGIQSPHAIRDFISHAWHRWEKPAPRFVLLAGDAGWDGRHDQAGQRNLVPTLQVQAHDELAASDNGFVTVADDDWRPDLAIGRIPASSAGELSLIIAKLIRYSSQAEIGPWRRSVAWVTDKNPNFQKFSKDLAGDLSKAGFGARLIYPSLQAAAGEQDQQTLKQALVDGQLLVHFVGHGGRFVWRTGPPDYRNSTDLFSSSDVEALPPSARLPLVLSMTCSSGPFDHPTADSIAETFLRLPDRGAIGVLAASWRVPASARFSAALVEQLTSDDATIGEAVMRAKRSGASRALVESYNFLGDPALRMSLPARGLPLKVEVSENFLRVSLDEGLERFPSGTAIVDWLDSEGRSLKTVEQAVNGRRLAFVYPLDTGEPRPTALVMYVWSSVSGNDRLGSVMIGVGGSRSDN
jgi:hypothetical protein